MTTKLSILITTYNRAFFLDKLLNSIVENCQNQEKIEVIVFNNGSTDDTDSVIEKYKGKILNFKTEKVKETLDFTGGFFRLAELGSGDYFWYIGDDDYIVKPIDPLIVLLEEKSPDIVLLNHKFYIQEDVNDKEKLIDKKNFLFCRKENCFYSNYNQFIKNIKHINGFFTHIATCIVKKKNFKNFISEVIIEKYKKSKSHHIFLFLSVLKNAKKIGYIHDKYVCLRIGAPYYEWATLEGRIERIKMSSKYFLEMLNDVFEEKEIIEKFKKLILVNDVLVLIIGAKLKLNQVNLKYFFRIFKLLKNDYGNFPFFWYGIFPVLIIPSFFFKIIYRFFYRKK